jgi:hypothetical protein
MIEIFWLSAEDSVAILEDMQLKAFMVLICFISPHFTLLTFSNNCWTIELQIL